MKAIAKFLRENGAVHDDPQQRDQTNPPLCVDEAQLAEGFELIDRALDISDQAVG